MNIEFGNLAVKSKLHSFDAHRFETVYFQPDSAFQNSQKNPIYPDYQFFTVLLMIGDPKNVLIMTFHVNVSSSTRKICCLSCLPDWAEKNNKRHIQ